MKKCNIIKDSIKTYNKKRREEEILLYGKTLIINHIKKSKKIYNRNQFKKFKIKKEDF